MFASLGSPTRGLAILLGLCLDLAAMFPVAEAVASQTYAWNNVKIGGGGGFVPGIVRYAQIL